MDHQLGNWLPIYQRRHILVMAPLTVVVAAIFAAPLPLSEGRQLLILAAAVAVFGLPHGALDHLVGRRLLAPRLGRRWPALFIPAYLALTAAVVGLWWAAPRAMLAAFLTYSAWHFGASDLPERARSQGPTHLLAVARGLLPLALPALFHAAQVTRYFNWLIPESVALTEGFVRSVGGAAALLAIGLLAGLTAARVTGAPRRLDWVELAALTLLFASAPPLVSFLVYFCGWHSIRHLLELGAELAPVDPRAAAMRLWRSSWPLTLVTAVAAYPAWLLLRAGDVVGDAALAQVLFIGLAALTVPHMILGSLARGQSRVKGSPM